MILLIAVIAAAFAAIVWRWRQQSVTIPKGLHVFAVEASVNGHSGRRLLDPGHDQTTARNGILAASADLPEGCFLLLRVVAGHAPGFGSQIRAYVDSIERGQETTKKQISVAHLLRPIVEAVLIAGVAHLLGAGFRVAATLFVIAGIWGWVRSERRIDDKTAQRDREQQRARAQRGRVQSASSKEMLKKADASVHADVDLRLLVWGPEEHTATLNRALEQAQQTLAVLSTAEQHLVWRKINPSEAANPLLREHRDHRSLTMDAVELAVVASPADKFVNADRVNVPRGRVLIAPDRPFPVIKDPLDPQGLIPLGIINGRSDNPVIVGQPAEAMNKDKFFAGTAGAGKSEAMKWDIFASAKDNWPILAIDPQGSTVNETLSDLVRYVPERIGDLATFDLIDRDFSIAINPLDVASRDQIQDAMVALGAVAEKQLDFSNADRAGTMVKLAWKAMAGANLLIEDEKAKLCIAQTVDFFNDAEFRHAVVACSRTLGFKEILEMYAPGTGAFEAKSTAKEFGSSLQVIVRRFSDLLAIDVFANIFSSPLNRVSFPQLAADGRIVLVNLRRDDGINPAAALFFASYIPKELIRCIDMFKIRRDEVTKEHLSGRGLRFWVDEAASVISAEFVEICGKQYRKNGLGACYGFQDVNDFEPGARNSLLNITGTKIALRVGAKASVPLAPEIGSHNIISAQDIAAQPNFTAYVSAALETNDTEVPSVISVDLLPPLETYDGRFQAMTIAEKRSYFDDVRAQIEGVRARSRQEFCNPVKSILDEQGRVVVTGVEARQQLLPDDGSGLVRTAMTQLSVDALHKIAAAGVSPLDTVTPTTPTPTPTPPAVEILAAVETTGVGVDPAPSRNDDWGGWGLPNTTEEVSDED